jgi:hypothetical protein
MDVYVHMHVCICSVCMYVYNVCICSGMAAGRIFKKAYSYVGLEPSEHLIEPKAT